MKQNIDMIEIPESLNLAKQLNSAVVGKIVRTVLPPTKAHKFCWYNGDPADYDMLLSGQTLENAEGFGIYVELSFGNGEKLCINDGVNVRLVSEEELPKNYQLAITFNDGQALVFTVAMYGGICLHNGYYDNEYYIKSRNAVSPFSPDFDENFRRIFSESKQNLSAKAFLATEQRFPGICNGVIQDILFIARIHPKRKISTFTEDEKELLLRSIHSVLEDMTEHGGRDTEKDLFGNSGSYRTLMSKNSLVGGCAECGGSVTKEAYLGGSVYYCAECQKWK